MFTTSFANRSYEAELMDDLNLSSDDLRKNLDELAFINYWLGGNQVIIKALNQLLNEKVIQPTESIKIADLGSGGGDLLRVIAKWARKKHIQVSLTGIDANDFMINYSKQKSQEFPEINYIQQDIFSDEFHTQEYDLVTCSLFCHHFRDEHLKALFSKLNREVKKGYIINDLHRHWLAYYSIKILTKLFRGSYLVQHDAPLSVKRAFKRPELKKLLTESGAKSFKIKWLWAFRYQVICILNHRSNG